MCIVCIHKIAQLISPPLFPYSPSQTGRQAGGSICGLFLNPLRKTKCEATSASIFLKIDQKKKEKRRKKAKDPNRVSSAPVNRHGPCFLRERTLRRKFAATDDHPPNPQIAKSAEVRFRGRFSHPNDVGLVDPDLDCSALLGPLQEQGNYGRRLWEQQALDADLLGEGEVQRRCASFVMRSERRGRRPRYYLPSVILRLKQDAFFILLLYCSMKRPRLGVIVSRLR